MPIDEKFPENLKIIGKTSHSDGENKHFIWGPGRTDGEAFSDDNVKAAYEARGESQRFLIERFRFNRAIY